jgi:hypothetical protein
MALTAEQQRQNEQRAELGSAAIEAGCDDNNDEHTNAVDTIANVLHQAAEHPDDARRIIDSAYSHYHAEALGYD